MITSQFIYFLCVLAARTLIIAAFLAIGIRLSGKRLLGQMNVYDLAMIMALANAVQNAMTSGTGDLWTGIICAGTLFLFGRVIAAIFVNIPKIEETLAGVPIVLAKDGKLIADRLRLESISEDDVLMAIRSQGLKEVHDTKLIVLECDGSLSVIPRERPSGEPVPATN